MASFGGYVVLIIGLSLLLAMAGVQTTAGALLGNFVSFNSTSPTAEFGVDTSKFNTTGSAFLLSLIAIATGLALLLAGRTILGGTFGIAETIKVSVIAVIVPVMIADLLGIMSYTNGLTGVGVILKIVALVVYLPLAVAFVFSAIDWIGGGK